MRQDCCRQQLLAQVSIAIYSIHWWAGRACKATKCTHLEDTRAANKSEEEKWETGLLLMAACSSVSTATYSVNSVFGPLQSTVFNGSTHYTHTHLLLSVHMLAHTHMHTRTHTNMQNLYTADPDIIIMVDTASTMNRLSIPSVSRPHNAHVQSWE